MSPVLHRASDVLSLRHGPSWLLLALAAGAVNAGAFVACESFVAHMTGIVSRIGLDAGAWALMLEYALVLVSFIGGAMMSVLAIQARVIRGKRPLHALPLLAVAVVLAAIGFAGHLGAFGPIGGQVDETTDFAFVCILAFAMGLMNASVATSTALSVRTTHMTGPATDFGVHLTIAWFATGDERKNALRLAALRGGKLVSFSLGAGLMIPAVGALGYLAFAAPAGFVLAATVRSFLPKSATLAREAALPAAL
ncbi:MAG: YoaK family protein [Byssovorax sp.]